MVTQYMRKWCWFALCLLAWCLVACREESSTSGTGVDWIPPVPLRTMPPGFDGFPARWNNQIREYLQGEQIALQQGIQDKCNKLVAMRDSAQRTQLLRQLDSDREALAIIGFRQSLGECLKIRGEEDLPPNLDWTDGGPQPEVGDPRARKGGHIRYAFMGSYPDTFRRIGPGSNGAFRNELYDNTEMWLTTLHPITLQPMPQLAHRWACLPDNRTIIFHIDPDARYSDGSPVYAIDFVVSIFVYSSDYTQSDYHRRMMFENVAQVITYGDHYISITLPRERPLLPLFCSLLPASPPHFYCEFGQDFVERYQWRVPPTAGPYRIKPGSVYRGRQITLERIPDWWGKNKKYMQHKYNIDTLTYLFIADETKALEMFRVGEIDVIDARRPDTWNQRLERPEFHRGYIARTAFSNVYPRPPMGLFLNTAQAPLDDINTRLGIQYALNIQGVVENQFRGDYVRLHSYSSGFGRYTNSGIRAREYSPTQARDYFARAGFTHTGKDGILERTDGTRLSLTITYPLNAEIAKILEPLCQDALKCGLELLADPLDSTVSSRKIREKRHQVAYHSWAVFPPFPRTFQGFHSSFAYDSQGNIKLNTNNITSSADPELDYAVEAERDAKTEDDMETACHVVQQLVHDSAVWVSGWTSEQARIAYWRWVCWPNSPTTQFAPTTTAFPLDAHLHWIDSVIQKEIQDAKRDHRSLPVIDQNL